MRAATVRKRPTQRIRAVLTNDPGMGVVRHVDAGYEEADACRIARGVDVPGRK